MKNFLVANELDVMDAANSEGRDVKVEAIRVIENEGGMEAEAFAMIHSITWPRTR